jgi:drug/metabolite transporter (DMT)-like permease
VLAVLLGLAAGLSWGVSDFMGGLKARTLDLIAVMVLSQGTGLVLVALIVASRGNGAPPGDELVYASLSGISGALGLAAFYRGLAVGVMAVVAPISATGAAIPVVAGLVSGERPSAAQATGIALAIVGVVMASREAHEEGRPPTVATGVGLALLAACGFGGFFVLMDAASDHDVFWAILVNRITGVSGLVGMALVLGRRLGMPPRQVAALVLIGTMDIAANTFYALGSTEGLISVVAVLASLYPVITVILARFVLHERVRASQRAGIAAALIGVALISAG